MKTGFVFDLDGTLVDSIPGIARGVNRALVSLGLPVYEESQVRGMVGKGARELCAAALRGHLGNDFPESKLDEMQAAFSREYPQTWRDGTVPYEGIAEVLLNLVEAGCPIAVLSNKPHVVTMPLVKHVFPHIPFDVVMGHSDQFPRKPSPDALLSIVQRWNRKPSEVCMVGDSAHDGNTALNAATSLVLVGWGYSTREALLAFDAPLCDDVAGLSKTLCGCI